MIEIRIYTTATGQSPFTEWQEGLDMAIGLRIRKRIERLALGNFGDYKSVGDGCLSFGCILVRDTASIMRRTGKPSCCF